MSLENALHLIQNDESFYYKAHGQRFYRTLEFMNHFGMTSGKIIDIGGGRQFEQLFNAFAPEADFSCTTCDLRDVLPYPDDHFAYSVCGEVIEHISDRDFFDQATFSGLFTMFSESYRILQQGGLVLFTTPNIAGYAALKNILLGGHPHNYASHYREYTLGELVAALEYVGFEIVHAGAEYVWMGEADRELMNKIVEFCNCSKDNRGDDLFIVCRKPGTGKGRLPSVQEAGKILSPQLRQYQQEVWTSNHHGENSEES